MSAPVTQTIMQDEKVTALKTIKAELLNVTPEMAMRWMMENKNNRHISDRTVTRYSKSMRDGKWDFNGESIKIAHDGTLLDGQHRLKAILNTGLTIPMMVVRGLPTSPLSKLLIPVKCALGAMSSACLIRTWVPAKL